MLVLPQPDGPTIADMPPVAKVALEPETAGTRSEERYELEPAG